MQTGPLLVERGLASAVGGVVGYSICKELAPVMMAILIAGRIGSAMAAEIGSMRVYQEIDALRTMNINPIHYLVLPRLVAIAIALPLLVMFAILVGWFGGGLCAWPTISIAISFQAFFSDLRDMVDVKDVANGVFKSFFFALVIGVVSCHQGLMTIGGPRGIGRSVTKAVVNSIVLIVICDYLLTRILDEVMSDTPSQTRGVSLQVRGLRKSFDGQEVLGALILRSSPAKSLSSWARAAAARASCSSISSAWKRRTPAKFSSTASPCSRRRSPNQYRMAMVFQSGALLNSLTVGENVGLYLTEHRLKPPEEIARIVAEKLEDVGLKDTEDKMPSDLSGGMKKRVAIARALVIEPQLILYDEPTSELDPLSAVVMGEEIVNLKERIHVTSLVVSHDRDLAFGVADRIAVINEGRILTIGTPDEVKRNSDPLIQEFLRADFKRL